MWFFDAIDPRKLWRSSKPNQTQPVPATATTPVAPAEPTKPVETTGKRKREHSHDKKEKEHHHKKRHKKEDAPAELSQPAVDLGTTIRLTEESAPALAPVNAVALPIPEPKTPPLVSQIPEVKSTHKRRHSHVTKNNQAADQNESKKIDDTNSEPLRKKRRHRYRPKPASTVKIPDVLPLSTGSIQTLGLSPQQAPLILRQFKTASPPKPIPKVIGLASPGVGLVKQVQPENTNICGGFSTDGVEAEFKAELDAHKERILKGKPRMTDPSSKKFQIG